MGTTILSFQHRVVIETLHNEGRSLRYIANYLGFSKTTIFNELHRLNGGGSLRSLKTLNT